MVANVALARAHVTHLRVWARSDAMAKPERGDGMPSTADRLATGGNTVSSSGSA